MYLTREEEAMLDGEKGEGVREAMKSLVKTGEYMGAENMVRIENAVAGPGGCGEYYGEKYIMKLAELGAKFMIPTYFWTSFTRIDRVQWRKMGVPEDKARFFLNYIEKIEDMGAIKGSQPFYPGKHISVGATTGCIANSLWSARTNIDSHLFSTLGGITGRMPNYGMHLQENRFGNILVKVKAKLEHTSDWSVLGYVVGQELLRGDWTKVPVFTGLPRCTLSHLRSLTNGLQAKTGPCHMFHVPGMTPEAPTIEAAFGPNIAEETLIVKDTDIEEMYDAYEPVGVGKEVQVVTNKCSTPISSIPDLQMWAKALKGKRVAEGVSLYIICTDRAVRVEANLMGLIEPIESAGGFIVSDTFFMYMEGVVTPPSVAKKRGFRTGVSYSLPQYLDAFTGIRFYTRPPDQVIEAALTGEVKEWSR